jgi:TetR/AcrR family transcriptional regulator
MKAELVERERVLVRQFSAALAGLEPILAARRELLTPLTMNLFGMMNWKFMWFRENGPVSHAAFAEMVMRSIEAAASTLVADLVPRASLAKR